MFLERGGVGVRVPGRLGALSLQGNQGIGCDRRRLGASVTLQILPLEADGPRGPGPAGHVLFGGDAGASSGAEPYCFPLRPVLVLVPIHSSCFLICIFFCMDMPSSDKQGFLFFWASLVRLFSFRSRVRSLGSGVSLLCPLSPKRKGVNEVCRET